MQVLTQRFYLYNYFFSLFQTDKYSSEIRENLSHTGRVVEALIFKSLLLCDDLAVEDNLSYYFFRNQVSHVSLEVWLVVCQEGIAIYIYANEEEMPLKRLILLFQQVKMIITTTIIVYLSERIIAVKICNIKRGVNIQQQ